MVVIVSIVVIGMSIAPIVVGAQNTSKQNKSDQIYCIVQAVEGRGKMDIFGTIVIAGNDSASSSLPNVLKHLKFKAYNDSGELVRVDNLRDISIEYGSFSVHFENYSSDALDLKTDIWVVLDKQTIHASNITTIENIPDLTAQQTSSSFSISENSMPYGGPGSGSGGAEIASYFPYFYSYASPGGSYANINSYGSGGVYAKGGWNTQTLAYAGVGTYFYRWTGATRTGYVDTSAKLTNGYVYNHYSAYVKIEVMMFEYDSYGHYLRANARTIWIQYGGSISSVNVYGYNSFTWTYGHYYQGRILITAFEHSGFWWWEGSYAVADPLTINGMHVYYS